MSDFFAALRLLTILPIPGAGNTPPSGRSLLWYPIVGGIIGGLLAAAGAIASSLWPPSVTAVLLTALWVVLTGGLHLDGLADCADAWVGAHRASNVKARTLEILKDPHCGVIGVSAICLSLLARFACIATIVESSVLALLPIPIIARATLPPLFVATTYISPQGLGERIAASLPQRRTVTVLVAATIAAIAVFDWMLWATPVWMMVLAALMVLAGVRYLSLVRLNGFTGDVAGALVELCEVVLLLLLAATINS